MQKMSKLLILVSLFFFTLIAKAENVDQLFHKIGDPTLGAKNSKIIIVEFFDYQCSHCINMAPILSAILKSNPHVRIVYKEFPIQGNISEFAARAALAANLQGKYEPFQQALFKAPKPLSEDAILEAAKSVGLNLSQLKKEMDSISIKNHIRATHQLAKKLKVTGTPAYFIGNSDAKNIDELKFVLGGMSQDQLQSEIDGKNLK